MQIRTTKATLTKPTTIIWKYDNKNNKKHDKPGYKNNCNKNSNKHDEPEINNNCNKWDFIQEYGNDLVSTRSLRFSFSFQFQFSATVFPEG